MTFKSERDFHSMRDDLSEVIGSAASAYAQNAGLSQLDVTALRQMNASVAQVAGELLMFGFDVWPESANSNEVDAERPPPSQDNRIRQDNDKIIPFTPPVRFTQNRAAAGATKLAYIQAVASLFVTVPIALLADYLLNPMAATAFFGLAILVSAVICGTRPALLLGLVSALVQNFLLIEPRLVLTMPSPAELALDAALLGAAIAVPFIWHYQLMVRREVAKAFSPFSHLAKRASR